MSDDAIYGQDYAGQIFNSNFEKLTVYGKVKRRRYEAGWLLFFMHKIRR